MKYNGLQEEVLRIGPSSANVCPVCEGGATREATFNIFQVDNNFLGYKCHRASCGIQGIVPCIGKSFTDVKSRRKPVPRVNRSEIPEDMYPRILSKFHLTVSMCADAGIEWYTDLDGNGRLWIPINTYDGRFGGFIGRMVEKKDGFKKAVTYKNDNANALAYYKADTSIAHQRVVVTEDAPSAIRLASSGVNAAAILGGDFTQLMAEELQSLGCRAILSLDPDAKDKAVRQAIKYSHLLPLSIRIGRKDVKDMDDEDFREFIESLPA